MAHLKLFSAKNPLLAGSYNIFFGWKRVISDLWALASLNKVFTAGVVSCLWDLNQCIIGKSSKVRFITENPWWVINRWRKGIMDYSGNKTAMGQERAMAATESIVRMNLSKDGKTLDLTATYLKEYGAKDIARMEFLRPLTNLAFGTNLCGPKGAKYIAQSDVLVNLTSLNMFYNRLGNEGIKYIAVSDNLLTLQNLVLTDNEITDEGALMFAKFMPLFTNLVRLDLRLNRIKDEGKNALKEAQKMSTVKHLLLDKVEGFQVKG